MFNVKYDYIVLSSTILIDLILDELSKYFIYISCFNFCKYVMFINF